MTQALDHPTEYPFSEDDFQWLRSTASAHSGIVLADVKRNMIYSRLSKRLRHLKLKSFAEYRKILDKGDSGEFVEFINAITTNLTSFFREPHHFEHLETVAIPHLISRSPTRRTLRVWSAGCSTGEESYTIAMVLADALARYPQWTAEVFASDLDTRVLERAASGVYEAERVSGLDQLPLRRWFLKGAGALEGKVKVKEELRKRIQFSQLNLTQDWRVDGRFDVVFCRNVVIYFDKQTQRKLFSAFADVMTDGAFLYIGHAESLHQVSDRFQLTGKTAYQRMN